MNFFTPKAGAKRELLFNKGQWPLRMSGTFLEKLTQPIQLRSSLKLRLHCRFYATQSRCRWQNQNCCQCCQFLLCGKGLAREPLLKIDHTVKIACLVKKKKKYFPVFKTTDLYQLVQGGQLYCSFPFSKYKSYECRYAECGLLSVMVPYQQSANINNDELYRLSGELCI